MEKHPLVKKLLEISLNYNLDQAKVYPAFELFLQLSQVQNLTGLECFYHEKLQTFYLQGKKKQEDTLHDIYVPIIFQNEVTLEELCNMQKCLCLNGEQFFIIIKDKDSCFTCYELFKGLKISQSVLKRNEQQFKGAHSMYNHQFIKSMYSKSLK